MIIPKKCRRKAPQLKGCYPHHTPAFIDTYGEHFSDDVDALLQVDLESDALLQVDLESDDPKEIRKIAKYLNKCADYFEYLEKNQ